MSEISHETITKMILSHCSVDISDLEPKEYQNLMLKIGKMHGAAYVWQKPSQVEVQLEEAREKLADAMESVRSLDNYAKSLARREADRKRGTDFQERILELEKIDLSQGDKRQRFKEICADQKPQPKEEWVDLAALAAMEKLRNSLVRPIEVAIPNAQTGPGRPPNRRAYLVAEHAYVIYFELTGKKPGFYEGSKTPFSKLVEALYQSYGINAGLKKPISAAMHKFK